jgi:hypothetical protein
MPQPKTVFRSVVVRAADIPDPEIREQIENRMFALDQARMEETQAHVELERASAKLLRARAARIEAQAALQESYGRGDTKVAMERNWEFFRDSTGAACAENFLSERDQRNMLRMQKANMNHQMQQYGGDEASHNDMFESGDGA